MVQRMMVIVSRGSHVHQAPQIGRAQSGPVSSTSVQNTIPTSADALAMRSNTGLPRQR